MTELYLHSRQIFELVYLHKNKVSYRYNREIISLVDGGFARYHEKSKRLDPIFEITFKGIWFAFIAIRHIDLWSDDSTIMFFKGLE